MAVREALDEALEAAQVRPQDGAAVELARTYATALDEGADLGKVGPAFLAALAALGMTPAARAALAGKAEPAGQEGARSPLDELRAKRRARQGA